MADSNEEWIRRRAYELWEAEGYPTGKDTEHWERAKLEYVSLNPAAAGSTKSRRKAGDTDEGATTPKAAKKTAAGSKPGDIAAAAKQRSQKDTSSKASASKPSTEKAPAAEMQQSAPASVEAPAKRRSKKMAAGS